MHGIGPLLRRQLAGGDENRLGSIDRARQRRRANILARTNGFAAVGPGREIAAQLDTFAGNVDFCHAVIQPANNFDG